MINRNKVLSFKLMCITYYRIFWLCALLFSCIQIRTVLVISILVVLNWAINSFELLFALPLLLFYFTKPRTVHLFSCFRQFYILMLHVKYSLNIKYYVILKFFELLKNLQKNKFKYFVECLLLYWYHLSILSLWLIIRFISFTNFTQTLLLLVPQVILPTLIYQTVVFKA